jgi:hypothetical protein
MQGVWVFASAAARDAAVTSPQEGNFAYLKDTNVTTYYTGSAWANLDTTGMTNPMTTTGDTIYSSSGSTPARLGIGSTGQVLTVAGGVPSWATPAGGGSGLNLISTTSFSAVSSVTPASAVFSSTYDNYLFRFNNLTASTNAFIGMRMRVGGTDYSGTEYRRQAFQVSGTVGDPFRETGLTSFNYMTYVNTGVSNVLQLELQNPYNTQVTSGFAIGSQAPNGNIEAYSNWYGLNTTTSYDSFTIIPTTGTITGSISVYGLGK